ncbi:MAG TPA: MauE/DoxX family redox-associated membrane protein [Candidatus Polarisedimenticolia bacterium]|nr:MauE/DoxX family redox-associated membrane protein [Candidatus Polarisedimenticolia bacterium]
MSSFLRVLPAIALGIVFLAAGILKAVDPDEFARQIATYGIVPELAARPAAYLLIPVEIALGAALVIGYRTRIAALLTSALLVVFMAATAFAWSQGRTEGCGCFGSFASRGPGDVLLEDTLFLALGVLAFLFAPRRAGVWRAAATAGVALAAGVALPLVAYALPLDGVVTGLRVGLPAGALQLHESPSDLGRGKHLVALLSLNDPGSRDQVKRLNALAAAGRAEVIAFYGGEVDDKTIFCFNTNPSFEVVAVPPSDLKRLYRKLPRFFLLNDGRVSRIWENVPPAPEEV